MSEGIRELIAHGVLLHKGLTCMKRRDIYLFSRVKHIIQEMGPQADLNKVSQYLKHHDCCESNTLYCALATEDEIEILAHYVRSVDDESYRENIVSLSYPTTLTYSPRTLARLLAKLYESLESLARNYMMVAIWKEYLGKELDPLEAQLSDYDSVCKMGADLFPVTHRALELYALSKATTHMLDNAQVCRSCGKAIARKKRIKCRKCGRMYFCSEKCQEDDTFNKTSGHAVNECKLLS